VYELTIKNSNENESIWIVYLLHETDGYQNTERKGWFALNMLGFFEPGQSFTWTGNVWSNYLVDDEFSGPSIYIMEKVAAYFDTEECRKCGGETKFYDAIAIPAQSLCSYE